MAITLDGTNGITHSSGTNQKVSLASETAVASTSGTSVDFILSADVAPYVKRVTVMFSGVSTSGTSEPLVQIGDSGGIETTGYVSTSVNAVNGGTSVSSSSTAGFIVRGVLASNTISGHMIITLLDSNNWVSSHTVKGGTTFNSVGAGDKTLSGTLDRIRITTVNGTDTFDAGSINILYE